MLETRSLHPTLAQEVIGLRLWERQDDATVAELRDLYARYGVLVFRRQALSEAELAGFCALLGPLERTVRTDWASPAVPEVTVLSNLKDGLGRSIGGLGDGELQWHSDQSYMITPATGAALYALELPPEGGETEFVSMRLAWERLPAERQAQLGGLIVRHSYAASRDQIDPELMTPAERDELPPVRRRMTWRNPANGRRALYLASHAFAVEGMAEDEGRALIAELMAAATRPEAIYRHAWRAGDVLMWDNRATMHRGRPWPAGEARVMVRTTVQAVEADGLSELRPVA